MNEMCRSRETACHVLRDDKFAHVTPHVKRDRFGVCVNMRIWKRCGNLGILDCHFCLCTLRQAQCRAFIFYLELMWKYEMRNTRLEIRDTIYEMRNMC